MATGQPAARNRRASSHIDQRERPSAWISTTPPAIPGSACFIDRVIGHHKTRLAAKVKAIQPEHAEYMTVNPLRVAPQGARIVR